MTHTAPPPLRDYQQACVTALANYRRHPADKLCSLRRALISFASQIMLSHLNQIVNYQGFVSQPGK